MNTISNNSVRQADSKYSYNTRYILGISFISALGGYLFGFDFAVIAGALPFLQKHFCWIAIGRGLQPAAWRWELLSAV